jgi:hypothetical protein
MNKTLIARAGAATAVVAALLFGSMTPAQAAVPESVHAASQSAYIPANTGPGGSSSGTAEGTGTGDGAKGGSAGVCQVSPPGAEKSPLLPVTRWSNATSAMHSRVDAGPIGLNLELIQRNTLQNGGMATGNFMWTTGAQLASFAIDFCILGSAGGAADNIGATIGNSLMKPENGLLAGLVFVGIIGLLFAGHRRGSILWKPIAMKAIIVACFIFMVVASGNTHGGGFQRPGEASPETGPYQPGPGSPGWIVTTLNNTVSSLASGPAAALAINPPPTGPGASSATDCDNYVAQLKQEYKNTYDNGTGKMSAGVPLILSGMWESTGLKSWRLAQFGSAEGGDSMNNRTYCHLLEQNAGTPVSTFGGDPNSVQDIMSRSMRAVGAKVPAGTDVWNSAAFVTGGDNVQQDRSLIAWAACKMTGGDPTQDSSWNTDDFNKGDKDHKATAGDCVKFFNNANPADTLDDFDWSDNGTDVTKRTTTGDQTAGPALNTFIQTLHGNQNAGGLMSIFAYNISALGMLIVFGAMALAIIVAKTAMVIMIVVLFFMMLQALMPGSDMSKIGGAIKTLLGMNLFVFCIQLIFAFITVFTKLLQDVGTGMLGGESNLIGILWSGLAPLAAVGILHMMFTKVMKIPSPFSLSGGLSWGNAMGAAAGGAAFAGMSSLLERGQSRMKSRAAGAVKGTGRSVLNVAAGRGRPVSASAAGRRNAAAPGGDQAPKDVLNGANVEAARRAAKGGAMAPGTSSANEAPLDDTRGDEAMGATAADTAAAPAAGAAAAGATAAVVAGKMDHTLLSTSRVANSQLHKGIKNGAERKVVKQMQAGEAAAALQAKKERDAAMGITQRTRVQKAGDNILGAAVAFKDNPVGFTRAAAGTGAKKAAVNGALAVGLLATTGMAAPVIYAGIKVGQHKYKEHKKNKAKTDAAVVQYRAETEKAKMRKVSRKPAGQEQAQDGGSSEQAQNNSGTVAPSEVSSNQGATGGGRPVSINTSELPKVTHEGPIPAETARPEQAAPARP